MSHPSILMLWKKLLFLRDSPPLHQPAPEGAGAHAIPPYYLYALF